VAIYLSGQMYDAVLDLTAHGSPVPPDLYDRFLAWARSPNAGTRLPVPRNSKFAA
jgi:hypothetical protein